MELKCGRADLLVKGGLCSSHWEPAFLVLQQLTFSVFSTDSRDSRILGTSKVGSSSFQITFRMASSTQKLVLRCRDSSDQDSWICALSQPVLTIFPLELPSRLAPQTYHSLAANLVTLQVDRSVRRAYGSVFEAMRAVRGSTSMAALSIVLFGRLRTAVKIQQLEALHCWASAVSVGLQLEALEKAEALADLNKEFLDKADLVPLHMGMKNVGSPKAISRTSFSLFTK